MYVFLFIFDSHEVLQGILAKAYKILHRDPGIFFNEVLPKANYKYRWRLAKDLKFWQVAFDM